MSRSPRMLVLSFAAVLPLLAAEPAVQPVAQLNPSEPVLSKDLNALDRIGLDRARPITSLGYEYESTTVRETGTDITRHIVRGRYAIGLFGAGIEVPVSCHYNPGAGNTVDNGFGDIVLSGTIANRFSDHVRMAGGIDVSLDTASRDELGNQASLITPLWAIAYDLDPTTRLTGGIRYTTDMARQSGIERTRDLEFRVGGLHSVSEQVFAVAEARQGSDFENNRLEFSVFIAAGLEFAPHHVVRLGSVQPFDRHTRDTQGWQGTLDYVYVF